MSTRVEPSPVRERGIFCNRTLNLRSIRAIGYDMDYTLVHYRVEAWEQRAFEHLRQRLSSQGFPVDGIEFDPDFVIRGLILDAELGNLLKVDRFGYVKRAFHGTRPIEFAEQRALYASTIVDLSERRWVFLNTFFSISEACMYASLVDRLDRRELHEVLGYADLYERVRSSLDAAHMEGQLKDEIRADPEHYVELDPDTPLALLDQKRAGKRLMLVTNSEWVFTRAMMSYAFDRFLPEGTTWRDLFDVVIVAARKPDFFSGRAPLFEVVTEDGLLLPSPGTLREGGHYFGGSAALVEAHLGLSGDEILYVGDHIYGDVKVSKSLLRWRTALIVREIEGDIRAAEARREDDALLAALMRDKDLLELRSCALRLEAQRAREGYGPPPAAPVADLQGELAAVRAQSVALDERIAPLARAATEVNNPLWGLLMRAGNDKSHLARQIERSADIYTSRVSNFLFYTPFAYLRAPRGTLPHDTDPAGPGATDSGDTRAG